MKTLRFNLLLCAFAVTFAVSGFADDKEKSGKSPSEKPSSKPGEKVVQAKEPLIGVKVVITAEEREVIQKYVKSVSIQAKPGKKAKGLPPGLAKKVARGGDLPPGWQKKCVPGTIMPAEVYKVCHPLPKEVIVKLPPPPTGTILVTVDGKVVRLAKATLEILDVFDVL
jgi:hypothetical protein